MPTPNAAMRLQAESRYADARERIAELRKKLERTQKELDEAEQEASGWLAFLERYEMLLNGKTNPTKPSESKLSVKRTSLSGAVTELLMSKGGAPMTLTAIINELKIKGFGIDKENFRTILNTALWRRAQESPSRLFVKDDEGYRLASDDFELTD